MTVPESDPLPPPLDALADLRSAAKWTLLAVGAVGAALISGGPLVAVGQVHGVAHAVLAGLGLVIALAGVGLAIWHTSRVLEPRLTTPGDLTSRALAGLRQQVERNPVWFFGYVATSVEDLVSYQVIAANLARQFTEEMDAARRKLIEPRLCQVGRDAARADPYVRFLVAAAHVWKLNEDLRRSRWYTMLGGVLVVAGGVLFFTATGGH